MELSIIVPVYNTEKHLSRCIDSILNQTFEHFELILVDDGSSDRSWEICDRYAQKDRRVRVIHQSNGGVSSARNAGLDAAKGEYISFVDSDDWIHPCYFEYLRASLYEYETDAATLNNICMKEYCEPEPISYVEIDRKQYSGNFIRGNYYNMQFNPQ